AQSHPRPSPPHRHKAGPGQLTTQPATPAPNPTQIHSNRPAHTLNTGQDSYATASCCEQNPVIMELRAAGPSRSQVAGPLDDEAGAWPAGPGDLFCHSQVPWSHDLGTGNLPPGQLCLLMPQ